MNSDVPFISIHEFKNLMDSKMKNITIIDVRSNVEIS